MSSFILGGSLGCYFSGEKISQLILNCMDILFFYLEGIAGISMNP